MTTTIRITHANGQTIAIDVPMSVVHAYRETRFARGERLSSYLPANDPMTDEEWEQVCAGIDRAIG
jgi:hypothetical protein